MQLTLGLRLQSSWTEKWTSWATEIGETLLVHAQKHSKFICAQLSHQEHPSHPPPAQPYGNLAWPPFLPGHMTSISFPAIFGDHFKKTFYYGNFQIFSKEEKLDKCTYMYQSSVSTSIKSWIRLLNLYFDSPSTSPYCIISKQIQDIIPFCQ